MTISTKIRLLQKGEVARVLVLVNHPMQAGNGQAANYIERMVFELNDIRVAETRLGPGVDENPLTGIAVGPVRAGDRTVVRWSDNRGGNGSAMTIVKQARTNEVNHESAAHTNL